MVAQLGDGCHRRKEVRQGRLPAAATGLGWEGNCKALALSAVVQAHYNLHGNYMNLCSPVIEILVKFGSNRFELSAKSENYFFVQYLP